MATALQQYHGVGRRKTSVARAWLRPGTGVWEVNGRSLDEYFPRLAHQQHVQEPLIVTQNQGRFDIKLNLTGGGLTGQAGAASPAAGGAGAGASPAAAAQPDRGGHAGHGRKQPGGGGQP